MTWGALGLLALTENCRYFCDDGHIPFLAKYVDLQRYRESRLSGIGTIQMDLSTRAQLLGIHEEEPEHHHALDDSIPSLECSRVLYQKDTFESTIRDADNPDFYPRPISKTVIPSDWEYPMVCGVDMIILYDCCGLGTEQLSDWIVRSKSFCVGFYCPHCDYRFIGHIQFRLKCGDLIVKKGNLPLQEEPQEEAAKGGEDMADLVPDPQDIQEESQRV